MEPVDRNQRRRPIARRSSIEAAALLALLILSTQLVPLRRASADAGTSMIITGGTPMGMTYDPAQGELFIATAYSVVVTSGGGDVIDSIPASTLMPFPCNLVYVPSTYQVYVANCGGDASHAITIIDPCTDRIVGTIALLQQPFGLAYDSNTDQVFAADSSGTVYAIDVQSHQVVHTISVPSGYYGVLFDPNADEIYVSNADNNTVSVISDAGYAVLATINVGAFPMGMGLDPARGVVFVANFVSGTVSAIADGNLTVVRTVQVGWLPSGVAVNPCTGTAYVSNGDSYSVVEVDPSSYATSPCLVAGSTLGMPLFVQETGQMYVPCVTTGQVAMFAA